MSVVVVLIMMALTILSATGATLLRYIEDEETVLFQVVDVDAAGLGSGSGNDLVDMSYGTADAQVIDLISIEEYDRRIAARDSLNFFMRFWMKSKYIILSAAANLTIIVIFGWIFERIAESLTQFENHRTESDYSNALVVKNFCFQFVNNYFVLFYIGCKSTSNLLLLVI